MRPLRALLVLALLLTGCSLIIPWAQLYKGDGTYGKKNGVYQVWLGKVPIDQKGTTAFSFSRLGPRWEWATVLRIVPVDLPREALYEPDSSRLRRDLLPRADIRLVLSSDDAGEIFAFQAPLEDWSWNWNRAVGQGRGEEYQPSTGGYRFRRFDVGPHDSWGTSFTSRSSSSYSLRVEVLEPAASDPRVEVWVVLEKYLGSL